VKAFAGSQGGATAIEYALIAALISIVIVAVVTTVGIDVKALFQRLVDKI
jgi:pilus assembly protein Flp/PilA